MGQTTEIPSLTGNGADILIEDFHEKECDFVKSVWSSFTPNQFVILTFLRFVKGVATLHKLYIMPRIHTSNNKINRKSWNKTDIINGVRVECHFECFLSDLFRSISTCAHPGHEKEQTTLDWEYPSFRFSACCTCRLRLSEVGAKLHRGSNSSTAGKVGQQLTDQV